MTSPPPTSLDERQALGLAIKKARQDAGITQQKAADALGYDVQTWKRYEWGQRNLHVDQIDRIASILGTTRTELLYERDRLLGDAVIQITRPAQPEFDERFEVSIGGRAKAGERAPLSYDAAEQLDTMDLSWMMTTDAGYLRVSGDSETGFVESGQVVIYRRSIWPRKEDGCVIETKAGEMYVKEYLRSDDDTVYVKQRFPEKEIEFNRAELRGVYKVILRGG